MAMRGGRSTAESTPWHKLIPFCHRRRYGSTCKENRIDGLANSLRSKHHPNPNPRSFLSPVESLHSLSLGGLQPRSDFISSLAENGARKLRIPDRKTAALRSL